MRRERKDGFFMRLLKMWGSLWLARKIFGFNKKKNKRRRWF